MPPIPVTPFDGIDYFTLLQNGTAHLMITYSAGFARFARNIFTVAAICKMIATGARIAYDRGDLGDANLLFAKTVFESAVGFTIVTFYAIPDPVFGYSFSQIIVDQMGQFTTMLDHDIVTRAVTTLDGLFLRFIPPGSNWEILGNVIYYGVFFLITAAKIVVLVIVSFSLWSAATLVLVGPIFCSLYLVPHFKMWFWSWLHAFIQYSFLQVLAYAYMLVGVHFLTNVLSKAPVVTSDLYTTKGAIILVFVGSFILGFPLVLRLNNSLFSGHAQPSFVNIIRLKR